MLSSLCISLLTPSLVTLHQHIVIYSVQACKEYSNKSIFKKSNIRKDCTQVLETLFVCQQIGFCIDSAVFIFQMLLADFKEPPLFFYFILLISRIKYSGREGCGLLIQNGTQSEITILSYSLAKNLWVLSLNCHWLVYYIIVQYKLSFNK